MIAGGRETLLCKASGASWLVIVLSSYKLLVTACSSSSDRAGKRHMKSVAVSKGALGVTA